MLPTPIPCIILYGIHYIFTGDINLVVYWAWGLIHKFIANHVSQVVIYNRVDCCAERINGISVYIVDGVSKSLCTAISGLSGNWATPIQVDCELKGYVIRMEKNGDITLCEVQVYGQLAGYFLLHSSSPKSG